MREQSDNHNPTADLLAGPLKWCGTGWDRLTSRLFKEKSDNAHLRISSDGHTEKGAAKYLFTMIWGIGVGNISYQILISTSVPYIQANLLSPLDYSDYISKSLDHPGIVATVCKELG